jgi:hypothetical protein
MGAAVFLRDEFCIDLCKSLLGLVFLKFDAASCSGALSHKSMKPRLMKILVLYRDLVMYRDLVLYRGRGCVEAKCDEWASYIAV